MPVCVFSNFNHSVWHAFWLVVPIGVFAYLVAFFSLRKGHYYLFDPKHNADSRLQDAGDYKDHYQRYQDLAKLVVTLSAAAIAFLINTLANDKPDANAFIQKIEKVAPICAGFFGTSIAFLIGFMVLQTVFYEAYCHSPTHSTYSRSKYAINQCLGWSGLIAFVLGFSWLAVNIF